MEELEKITEKKAGLSTWPQAGILWMKEHGFEVENIEVFDYERFIREGLKYLQEFYGEEAGQWQEKYSDIPKEQQRCKDFIQKINTEKRLPDFNDIKKFVDEGYLVLCLINAMTLENKEGYSGHVIVVIGYDDNGLFMHDPGPPPIENRYVSWQDFENAWAFPDEKVKSITAFKRLNS